MAVNDEENESFPKGPRHNAGATKLGPKSTGNIRERELPFIITHANHFTYICAFNSQHPSMRYVIFTPFYR